MHTDFGNKKDELPSAIPCKRKTARNWKLEYKDQLHNLDAFGLGLNTVFPLM